jgi:hypothetical protein
MAERVKIELTKPQYDVLCSITARTETDIEQDGSASIGWDGGRVKALRGLREAMRRAVPVVVLSRAESEALTSAANPPQTETGEPLLDKAAARRWQTLERAVRKARDYMEPR